jgi:hypothetical protein
MDQAERRRLLVNLLAVRPETVDPRLSPQDIVSAVLYGEVTVEPWSAEAAGIWATGRHVVFVWDDVRLDYHEVTDERFASLRFLRISFVEV